MRERIQPQNVLVGEFIAQGLDGQVEGAVPGRNSDSRPAAESLKPTKLHGHAQ